MTAASAIIERVSPAADRSSTGARDAGDMARVAAGDVEALTELYDRYGPVAYGFALRLLRDHHLAEECVQDAFVALWRRADRFDPSRAKLTTWLLTVVRNRAVEVLRASAARPADLRAEVEHDETEAGPAELVADAERAGRVAEALAALPEPQLAAVRLAYFEGLSHAEIADRLDVPVGTVKSRIRLGLERLRPLVDELRVEVAT